MGRRKGFLWLTAGVVVAILAAAVAFIALQRGVTQSTGPAGLKAGPTASVVVAAQAVGIREALDAADLVVKDLPAEAVPEGAVTDMAQAVGKITLVELYPGETILSQRLVDPNVISGDGREALALAPEQVLMAFPSTDLMSGLGVLKPGDHVDLLFSLDVPAVSSGTGTSDFVLTTFGLLGNVTIAAIVTQRLGQDEATGLPLAFLFALDPQDALLLKYAKDMGGLVDVVLRAPGVEAPFETEPVDIDYLISRYRIPAGSRR